MTKPARKDTDKAPNPAPRKRGGQPSNRNNLRHGLRGGQLPRDAKYIEVRLNAFRRLLEDAVTASKGTVSITDAAFVQTALRWERHAALAQRWLTKAHDEMSPSERLTFSREIARASAERDKAVAALGLNRNEVRNAWAVLDVASKEDRSDGD